MRRLVTIAVCAALSLTLASCPSRAQTSSTRLLPGRVCLMYAPVPVIGHVGWAVRAENGLWYGGGTDPSNRWFQPMRNWIAGPYSFRRLLATFHGQNPISAYRSFRCRSVRSRGSLAALAEFRSVARWPYDVVSSNCLTRSIRTLKAYSGDLSEMPSGIAQRPSDYYHRTLTVIGWENSRNW
ncbi:hypothetical protein SMC26_43780 [Actinomadura fulvescens]|uniref:DUF4105 domain-containing protein n=1 Tax=Actinomadura fulvescens TaxID=46160 RepID=A0ABP6D981_9ACTN